MTLIRKAVLENLKIEKNGISIEELPFVGKLNLRGNPKDKDFLSNVDSILKTVIPLDPNTKIQNKDFQVIWLSPNEWLLSFINNDIFIEILNKLYNQLDPEKTSVTDISENKTIIRIEGSHTSELLRKFMVIDIDNVLNTDFKPYDSKTVYLNVIS